MYNLPTEVVLGNSQLCFKDLNDELLPTLMGRLMAETRVSHDRLVTANYGVQRTVGGRRLSP